MFAYAAPKNDQSGVTSLNGDTLSVDDAASLSDTTIETGSIEQALGGGVFDDTAILTGGVDDASGTAGLTGKNTASNGRVDDLVGTGVSVQTFDSVENISNAAQTMTGGEGRGGVPTLASTFALNGQLIFPNNNFQNNGPIANGSVNNLVGTDVSVQTIDSVVNVSNAAQDMTVGGGAGNVSALALNGQLPFPNNPFPSNGPIDSNEWHYNTGDSSFLVKTQMRPQLPNATNGVMQLYFNTWNPSDPSNNTFFGSEAISGSTQAQPLMFNPNKDGQDGHPHPLKFIAEARYEPNQDGTIQRGIIGGFMFLYSDSGDPNTHDEIDFEGMSNFPTQIQTNIYHNEPAGSGHPIKNSFSPDSTLATFHKYEIDWYTNKVVWKVDDQAVRTVTDPNLVPTQDMALHFNIWTGAADWETSDPSTQPTDASNDHRYTIDVKSVHVEEIALEPAAAIQNHGLAITRTALSPDQATAIADSINAGKQAVADFIDNLLSQVADTTIPAVAVEASMYNAVGSSAEVTTLVSQFLPFQIVNAIQYGLNTQVYACEALGLAFAFGDENGGHAFADNYGPLNGAMPATPAGDASFAAAAANAIFGSAATAPAILEWVTNWVTFYTANGIPGVPDATAAQIDLAARGAAWGDAVGVALANNLGPLPGQVTKFLEDAAQGIAVYSASLASQPTPAPFDVTPGTPPTGSSAAVQLIGVPATASDPLAADHT